MESKDIAEALGAVSLGTFQENVAKLSPEMRVECAGHFEVAVSTVDRWATGSARPHPLLRMQIVKWVTRRLAS